MPSISHYPAQCRQSIEAVADKFRTDYDTAYAMILLEALLYDLNPADSCVAEMIINDATSYVD